MSESSVITTDNSVKPKYPHVRIVQPDFLFMEQVSPWVATFSLIPTQLWDERIVWGVPIFSALFQTRQHLDGPTMPVTYFTWGETVAA